MTIFDHLLALVVAVGLPVYAAAAYPGTLRKLQAGVAGVRLREYREIIVIQWLLVIGLFWLWQRATRPLAETGLLWPEGWRLWASIALALAGCAFFASQVYAVANTAKAREQVRKQLGTLPEVTDLIPRSAGEARWFVALSITAGICEEILYRGFLLFYLKAFTGHWIAVALAVVVFCAGHFYQGVTGMLRAGMMGALLMGVYLLTGSLLAPVVLHIATDIGGGLTGWHALREPQDASAARQTA